MVSWLVRLSVHVQKQVENSLSQRMPIIDQWEECSAAG